jgi:hypothetical protein
MNNFVLPIKAVYKETQAVDESALRVWRPSVGKELGFQREVVGVAIKKFCATACFI